MIRHTLESYIHCKKWLENYEAKRNYFISTLNGTTIPGISYEEKAVGTPMPEEIRKALISDALDEYDKKLRQEKKHCESVMNLCHKWINSTQKNNKQAMIMVFVEGFTHCEVGNILYWSRQKVSYVIDAECNKLDENLF